METGVRNLIRTAPLETVVHETEHGRIVLPTLEEMLRIKAWLIVTRNATRDYWDAAALADRIEHEHGEPGVWRALEPLDRLYQQQNGSSVTLQLAKQLAEPHPNDLGEVELGEYCGLAPRWRSWGAVVERAAGYGRLVLRNYGRPA